MVTQFASWDSIHFVYFRFGFLPFQLSPYPPSIPHYQPGSDSFPFIYFRFCFFSIISILLYPTDISFTTYNFRVRFPPYSFSKTEMRFTSTFCYLRNGCTSNEITFLTQPYVPTVLRYGYIYITLIAHTIQIHILRLHRYLLLHRIRISFISFISVRLPFISFLSVRLPFILFLSVRLRFILFTSCLLYTSPSPRDQRGSRMPSSA